MPSSVEKGALSCGAGVGTLVGVNGTTSEVSWRKERERERDEEKEREREMEGDQQGCRGRETDGRNRGVVRS